MRPNFSCIVSGRPYLFRFHFVCDTSHCRKCAQAIGAIYEFDAANPRSDAKRTGKPQLLYEQNSLSDEFFNVHDQGRHYPGAGAPDFQDFRI